jgi:hypothetical protein
VCACEHVDRYPPPARPATADTCGTLPGFVNEVQAQSGKSIPAGQAAQLIADTKRIQAVLTG